MSNIMPLAYYINMERTVTPNDIKHFQLFV